MEDLADSTPILPYLGGLLEAIPRALERLVPVRWWVVLERRVDGLHPITSSGSPAPEVDEQLVYEVLAVGSARVIDDPAASPESGAVLVVPLARKNPGHLCFYAELAGTIAPEQLEHWEGLTRGCGEIAGAAVEAIAGLRGLLEEASEGIVVADAQGNYIDVNRAACEIVGFPREQMLRLNYRELLLPKEEESRPIRYQRLFAGETVRIERELQRADGQAVVVELSGKLVSDGRFLALARDITDRRRGEQALSESEERYRVLTEAAFEAIGIHEDGAWVEVNQALADAVHSSPARLAGAPVRDLLGRREWERIEKLSLEQRARPFEVAGKRPDGTAVCYEVCAKTVPYRGRTARLVAARDITARKRAEADLARLAAERRRLAAKVIEVQEQERLILARELHDHVGQVLTVLKMDASWLTKQATRPDEVRAVAARIDAKADEMLRVVRDLSYTLRPAVLDDLGLGCAIETLVNELAKHSPTTFDVELDGPEQLPTAISTALYRIAQEALTNVIRHGRARRCTVSMQVGDESVGLQIEHDGVIVGRAALDDGAAMGIAGMRERSIMLGGAFDIAPRDGGGTVLRAQIPLDGLGESSVERITG